MGKIKEKDAAESLIKMLSSFLKLSGEKKLDKAREIDDFTAFDLMEYNKKFENFSDEMKDIIEKLLFMHEWKGSGVYYGKECYLNNTKIKDFIKRLKKLKT